MTSGPCFLGHQAGGSGTYGVPGVTTARDFSPSMTATRFKIINVIERLSILIDHDDWRTAGRPAGSAFGGAWGRHERAVTC